MKINRNKRVNHSMRNCGRSALTLTLSPGEREQPPPLLRLFIDYSANIDSPSFAGLKTILPLPSGEGRGEGSRNVPCSGFHEFNF